MLLPFRRLSASSTLLFAATTGRVTRTGDLQGDLVVSLSSDDTSEATVPATVTILDGDSFADFPVDAVPDGFKDEDADVRITASAAGQTPAEASSFIGSGPLIRN
jgi:hypothetical protein